MFTFPFKNNSISSVKEKPLLDDSAFTVNDLSNSEIDQLYNSFYGEDKHDIPKVDIILLILFMYNESLKVNENKRLPIIAKVFCLDVKDRILERGFNALCQFHNSQPISDQDLANSNFKICGSATKSERLKKFICCFVKSSSVRQKEEFGQLVKHMSNRMELIQKVFKLSYESNSLEDFTKLCQACNINATITQDIVENVWRLLSENKDKKVKAMISIITDASFRDLISNLSNTNSIFSRIQINNQNKQYLSIN